MNTRVCPIPLLVATVLALDACGVCLADEPQPAQAVITETSAQRAERMQWFNDARFGMFIHWGVYSVPAGEYGGKTGYGEWIMESAKIPVSTYEGFTDQFNPVKFNAREWVRTARDAGMKYIVITSKHHDGFGLWDSKLTDWDIGRTPFQRDPLKELADACAAADIRFCFYHSIMDWHHPDWGKRRAWNDLATGTPDMDRYTQYLKGQLRELLTGYGPIGILWFDGQWEEPWTRDRGIDLYNYVRGLQPEIIINNRVGKPDDSASGIGFVEKGDIGDYGTPEQEIPATGFGPDVAWESCMTMNNHWGYNKNDHDWKSTTTLVRNLIDCASKGGNYLLNIGPTAEGLFPQPCVQRLDEIGAWMKVNGVSIYGTTASPFRKLAWGRCTQKADEAGTTLFLHVFDWPADGRLLVPGLRNQFKSVALLADGRQLMTRRVEDSVEIRVPQSAPDAISTTIVLQIAGRPDVAEFRVQPSPDGSLLLEAFDAEVKGGTLRTESRDGKVNLGYWTHTVDWAQWPIRLTQAGKYVVTAEIAAEMAGEFLVEADGQKLVSMSKDTGSYSQYTVLTLGTLELKAGTHALTVRPVVTHWNPMNLRWLKLTPMGESAE